MKLSKGCAILKHIAENYISMGHRDDAVRMLRINAALYRERSNECRATSLRRSIALANDCLALERLADTYASVPLQPEIDAHAKL